MKEGLCEGDQKDGVSFKGVLASNHGIILFLLESHSGGLLALTTYFVFVKVIDETLRIVNIAFVSFRQATEDTYVNGYLIPKGWKVQLWYRSVNLDPHIYPDPKNFNPSRWDHFTPKAGSFLPFGLGSRLCPGNELAKLEISVFLHYFVLGYQLTRKDPHCRVRYLPHPRPTDNCMAKITKLNKISANET
ncbi:unnamed protein product [Musa acuminata subsp. burmannicoides]